MLSNSGSYVSLTAVLCLSAFNRSPQAALARKKGMAQNIKTFCTEIECRIECVGVLY